MAPKNHPLDSELLASIALEACKAMLSYALNVKSSGGATIATNLHLISLELQSQPIYQLHQEIQGFSRTALEDLVQICTWSTGSARPLTNLSSQELYNELVRLFRNEKDQVDKSVNKFLKQNKIEPYQSRFETLRDKLLRNQGSDQSSADKSAYENLKPPSEDAYPDQINKNLFYILKEHSLCNATAGATGAKVSRQLQWHHTRLGLDTTPQMHKQPYFHVLIAASDLKHWQEFSLSVSWQTEAVRGHLKVDDDCSNICGESENHPPRMEKGEICQILEEPTDARIRLELDEKCFLRKLQDPEPLTHFTAPGQGKPLSSLLHHLTVENKINLSYAIARACWQFYSSELMNARWTSENIWFMPADDDDYPECDWIPLKAFISVPFDQNDPSLVEFLETGQFTHRYPRVLSLGIVLLEIGLGETLGIKHSATSSLNHMHSKAKMRLRQLRTAQWDGFLYKDTFAEAVENCLTSTNFNHTRKSRPKIGGQGKLDPGTSPLVDRRNALYQKVVAPLMWLANVGFKDSEEKMASEEISFVRVKRAELRKSTILEQDEFLHSWSGIRGANFNTGHSINPESWFDMLKVIAGHIFRCRRVAKVTTPIRLAILDTGYDPNLAFFQDSQRSNFLKGWKDFAASSESPVDIYGHGTFMTRLAMHVAPFADIYVARVAESKEQLDTKQEKIAEAIRWAVRKWKVNVISMSFGFPSTSLAISQAISSIQEEPDCSTILLASAGNLASYQGEAFPARHPSVISIYATNYKGTFLESNPTQFGEGHPVLGTYGDNIPASVLEEVQQNFPRTDFGPGTSIATAIASGIVAMMLSYAAALPSLLEFKFKGAGEIFKKLSTTDGMRRLLQEMSQNTAHHRDFVNPVRFWADRSDDVKVFMAICGAISKPST